MTYTFKGFNNFLLNCSVDDVYHVKMCFYGFQRDTKNNIINTFILSTAYIYMAGILNIILYNTTTGYNSVIVGKETKKKT